MENAIIFDPASVKLEGICKAAGIGSPRVLITGELEKVCYRTQVGIGFGKAVTPGPVQAVFPLVSADFSAVSTIIAFTTN